MPAFRPLTRLYDAECAAEPMLRRDVPFLLKHAFGDDKPLDVLEIGVGTGRVAVPLTVAGHRVTGIDPSAEALSVAAARRGEANVAGTSLRLIDGDATDLPTLLPRRERFDRVVLLFNTVANWTDPETRATLLRSCRDRLRVGGTLWVDTFHPDPSLLATLLSDGEVRGLDPTTFFVPSFGVGVLRETDVRLVAEAESPDRSRPIQRVTYRYGWFDAKGRRRSTRQTFDVVPLWPGELAGELRAAGLAVTDSWGDHDGSPLRPTSPRIILHATRGR